ncbi:MULTISPECIES: ribosomal protein L7/L12 [unclassified Tolypothrix]|uniref:ribosomal protein L7/L12 n=1 Tax=unclassified Tolypothrix TaxID=2649714 RepID=UPI000693A9BD|nr:MULTISPECIES: ribosomal protein L7/L12 [unclassified Tolypothrix]MBE9086843.1 ribosomal protein L7/L12 [Tolypothrix sp. LEGE 11397]UYD28140.1 ribosomal protein L7/L12 [Tolypothrix sp. PCC 7712]UYD35987.1 ribosomal protein L7/L12 [Tolypothrix sp. PCC 7601]BAY94424.1 50S ribosomal protein L7/L12 [Microchaete diplosiphon NIES-3275]
MTSPAAEITVECPQCGQYYDTWYRPSLNFMLEDFDDEYIERVSTSICPHCGCKASLGVLIVNKTGDFNFQLPQANFRRKDEAAMCTIKIESFDSSKRLDVMKVLREITGLGLIEVKSLLDNIPEIIMRDIEQRKAELFKRDLEAAGAEISLKCF